MPVPVKDRQVFIAEVRERSAGLPAFDLHLRRAALNKDAFAPL